MRHAGLSVIIPALIFATAGPLRAQIRADTVDVIATVLEHHFGTGYRETMVFNDGTPSVVAEAACRVCSPMAVPSTRSPTVSRTNSASRTAPGP